MDLTTERHDGVLCARVAGRIDGANAAAFEQAIRAEIEDGDRAVILDFGNLVYISSAGLRAILMTAKSLLGRGAKFALHSLPDGIQKVFAISGFDKLIAIRESESEARAFVDG